MHNICIIYTGGTLGMELKAGNLVAANLDLNLAISDKWLTDHNINITYIEQEPIDSASIQSQFYIKLSKRLHKVADKFDGFVILHGTDTMEYTASVLAFLCLDINGPIVLTGAQLPLFKTDSDAKANIKNAILWCINSNVSGVNIAFGNYLVRGINSYKHSSIDFNAFRNTAEGFIGSINAKGDFEFYTNIIENIKHQIKSLPAHILPTLNSVCKRIDNLAVPQIAHMVRIVIFPGINEQDLINMAQHADIIFIEAYASGTAPQLPKFVDFLQQKIDENAKVILLSQARHIGVFQSEYATNMQSVVPEILSAKNMTFATALAKALFLDLTNIKEKEKWREVWQTNLIGEFSIYNNFLG